ncbi:MAG: FAD:protein FMN transferase [Gammaproteobacteria bacterium]|nr:FAD:protein FMN transferase [Gammaproteobacteria bacterium]MCW8986922.1 FAD:protein FMN transferase [Gammaproteobacteria bacterium]MCW9031387.1 FAD:protein FMN transferase [Gammaproteobacteria bacterium]
MKINHITNLPVLIGLIVLAALVSACQQQPREHHDSFLVFGTIINITLFDVDDKTAEESFRDMREDLKLMHEVWHPWEPGSLTRMNKMLEHTVEFSASPSELELIHIAKDLAIKSKHLFNPAVGKLSALWGFHSHKQSGVLPSAQAIHELVRQNPTLEDITIRGIRVNNRNPAVKIDLGGIAKGFAIDRLLTYLKQRGVHNALINTGGDLKVIGKHGNRPWKIAIRDPRIDTHKKQLNNKNTAASSDIVATLELNDNEAAFTSGDYERYFKNKKSKNKDKHFHHIIDPRTGYPAVGTQSITVLHQDAATADAAATALFIAGPKQWVEIAKSMNIKYVLLIDEEGKIHASEVMLKRVKFEQHREIIERVDL